ncbi:1488_t:CDS:10 [Diversispora eburnea]|uniref:1488_t:CDS:1 n=1 Tax=Diversispora eburnea TaxID=1213867 RepID=A0A9N8W2F9_9GLOM|nr:1488_t:CDS:10 [Diversispora eburnea]
MGGSSRNDRDYSIGSSSRRPRQDDNGSSSSVVGEVGREFANRYGGLFSEKDWKCPICSNINWARRTECNQCKTPKPGSETSMGSREGRGGGFMERDEVVEYKKSRDAEKDDEYDEFGRKRKKNRSASNNNYGNVLGLGLGHGHHIIVIARNVDHIVADRIQEIDQSPETIENIVDQDRYLGIPGTKEDHTGVDRVQLPEIAEDVPKSQQETSNTTECVEGIDAENENSHSDQNASNSAIIGMEQYTDTDEKNDEIDTDSIMRDKQYPDKDEIVSGKVIINKPSSMEISRGEAEGKENKDNNSGVVPENVNESSSNFMEISRDVTESTENKDNNSGVASEIVAINKSSSSLMEISRDVADSTENIDNDSGVVSKNIIINKSNSSLMEISRDVADSTEKKDNNSVVVSENVIINQSSSNFMEISRDVEGTDNNSGVSPKIVMINRSSSSLMEISRDVAESTENKDNNSGVVSKNGMVNKSNSSLMEISNEAEGTENKDNNSVVFSENGIINKSCSTVNSMDTENEEINKDNSSESENATICSMEVDDTEAKGSSEDAEISEGFEKFITNDSDSVVDNKSVSESENEKDTNEINTINTQNDSKEGEEGAEHREEMADHTVISKKTRQYNDSVGVEDEEEMADHTVISKKTRQEYNDSVEVEDEEEMKETRQEYNDSVGDNKSMSFNEPEDMKGTDYTNTHDSEEERTAETHRESSEEQPEEVERKKKLDAILHSDKSNIIEEDSMSEEEDELPSAPMLEGLCVECRDQEASFFCEQCKEDFCEVCFSMIHRTGSRLEHIHRPLKGETNDLQDNSKQEIIAQKASDDPNISNSSNGSKSDINQKESKQVSNEFDTEPAPTPIFISSGSSSYGDWIEERAKYIPLRLNTDERKRLRLLEAALNVSVLKQIELFIKLRIYVAFCPAFSDYNKGQELFKNKSFEDNEDFYQTIFEIGRRHKIMNPEKMRDAYGKLMYLLMDSIIPEVKDLLQLDLVIPIKTVYSFLEKQDVLKILHHQLIPDAVQEIIPDGKSRSQINHEIRKKERAIELISNHFSNHKISPEEIKQCLYSIGDNHAYLRSNRDCCIKMLKNLTTYFNPSKIESGYSLAIRSGKGGARLSHDHETQFFYANQTMSLWREIQNEMFKLWFLADQDLLSENNPYRLKDTGQGLNRMQRCPSVSHVMHSILHRAQKSAGYWIGSSVIHLGDKNVPNALMFIDKYNQVSRILNPILICLEGIQPLTNGNTGIRRYIEDTFGSVEELKKGICADFFRFAFDGSGADNFFDAGSCIDGRLTSAWNWCSLIEKKAYFPVFLLTGFVGFDGEGF